ncbi:biotin/lipoyl-containing protein, partial [Capnocytophaga bilenii]
MAEIITMPRLSDTMEEGVVAKWLKKVGDKVNEGDILAEIETDKATMEFESFHSGTLLYIGLQEGEGAKVDTLLAIIGKEGEDISALIGGGAPAAAAAPAAEAKPVAEVTSAPAAAMPAGVEVVTMPRLSDTMTEGTVASWLKKVGDTVKEGDILAEIETDKATMEFESFHSGTLLYIGLKEGESASVDSLLAIIGPAGTDVNAVLAALQGGGASAPAAAAAPAAESKPAAAAAPAATASNANDRVFASPLAKKIAQDKGINLAEVKGSGENGRIVRKDVENFTPSAKAAAPAASSASAAIPTVIPVGVEVTEEVKNSQMRKTIAKRLSESKFTAPHYYLAIEIDMDNAMASRAQINSLPDTKISFNDMVVKACAM